MNKESKGKIEEGNKEEKDAKGELSPSDIGQSHFSPEWKFMEKLQTKFQEIWGIFGILTNFGSKKQSFSPYALRHVVRAFARELKMEKKYIFGFGMNTHDYLCMAKKFGQVLSPQEVKKHSNNDLTSPILTHKKQSWEIEVLEGQMDTKLKNSTWVRK